MRAPALGVLLVLLAFSPASSDDGAPPVAPSIAPEELAERSASSKPPVIIDVRTAQEYAGGHIPGALNIPYDEVADRISEVDAPHGVALYCLVGPRARRGEAALLGAGYGQVLHLEGGLSAWEAAGLPVEVGE